MKAMELNITDISSQSESYSEKKVNFIDTYLSKLISDKRDLPFAYIIIKLSLILIPISICIFLLDGQNFLLNIIHTSLFLIYLGPFTLMLHNISHRRSWSKPYAWLRPYINWVLGPLMGQTPNSYFIHHIGMHHPENNLSADLSSTLSYQRDSVLHFGMYLFNFFVLGLLDLGQYLFEKRHFRLLKNLLIGELGYWLIVFLLLLLHWRATVVVFIFPVVFCRFAMMAGNWAQHAFVDPSSPQSSYRNSITCINSSYNRRCFNDGYHIGHHLKPSRHWTELPNDFRENMSLYAREKAIVFEKIDFFVIWFFLMLKRYDWLAHFYVNLEPEQLTKEQIIARLKHRTQLIA